MNEISFGTMDSDGDSDLAKGGLLDCLTVRWGIDSGKAKRSGMCRYGALESIARYAS